MNSLLSCSYNIIFSLFKQFGLVIKYRKSKVFHFSRSHSLFDSPPLDLSHSVLWCTCVICKSTHPEITSLQWYHLQIIQARLPWWPSFLQHILWQYYNHPDIPSSIAEILLFNSVFHNRVIPISISTLKPPLGVIGILPLKPWVSHILSICI